MSEMSERKKLILAAVVEQYIKTGEPVGSKGLISSSGLNVSSATIRNEMSELAAMGLLEQPHTSAGRVPSSQGYRYYIDNLMKNREIDDINRRLIEVGISSVAGDPERLLAQAGEILAEMTNCAAVSTTPPGECSIIRRVELVAVGTRTAMLVLLTSNGMLKSRLCRLDCELSPRIYEAFYNITASTLAGRSVSEIGVATMQTAAASLGPDAITMLPLLAAASELAQSAAQAQIKLEGQSNLLSHGDYGHSALELMEFLNNIEPISRVFGDIHGGFDVKISSENLYRQLQNSSVIAAKYCVNGKDAGTIGLIGPTRMDYEKIIPSVRYLTDIVGSLITQALEE